MRAQIPQLTSEGGTRSQVLADRHHSFCGLVAVGRLLASNEDGFRLLPKMQGEKPVWVL